MKNCLLIIAITFLLFGCSDRWRAIVYPNKDNLIEYREIGEFSSLEECRRASRSYLNDIDASETGDYECGKNCKYNKKLDIYICEETLR